MPTLIERGRNVSVHKDFWENLTSSSNMLALSQLWLCCLDTRKLGIIANKINNELRDYAPNMRSFDQAGVNAVNLWPGSFFGVGLFGTSAYLLTQGMNIVSDGINTSRTGVDHSGALKGLIGDSRINLSTSNITFLETNVSFTDGFLRPWSVLVGHKSLKDADLRLNIELICLQKWELFNPLKVSKTILLRNAVPVNIDAEELNYSGDKIIHRQVQFAFDRYDVNINPRLTSYSISKENIENISNILPEYKMEPNSAAAEMRESANRFKEPSTITFNPKPIIDGKSFESTIQPNGERAYDPNKFIDILQGAPSVPDITDKANQIVNNAKKDLIPTNKNITDNAPDILFLSDTDFDIDEPVFTDIASRIDDKLKLPTPPVLNVTDEGVNINRKRSSIFNVEKTQTADEVVASIIRQASDSRQSPNIIPDIANTNTEEIVDVVRATRILSTGKTPV